MVISNIVNKENAFSIPQNLEHYLAYRENVHGLLWNREGSQSDGNQHSSGVMKLKKTQAASASDNVRFFRDVIRLLRYCCDVRNRGTDQRETFVMRNAL